MTKFTENCANCGSPDTEIVGTTTTILIEVGKYRLEKVTARSEYCSGECLKEYGEPI